MAQTKFAHIHLALSPELADKFAVVCEAWQLKRPGALERLVDAEYNKIMRKRAEKAGPVVYTEKGERWVRG